MYWTVLFAWSIAGTALFWIILNSKWANLDPAFTMTASTFRVMHPVLPGEIGYFDLKFSLVRHAFVLIISALLIYFMDSRSICRILLFLNVIYAYLPISRYRHRKQYLNELASDGDEVTVHFGRILVKDSACTITYSIICVVVLYLLYGLSLAIKG